MTAFLFLRHVHIWSGKSNPVSLFPQKDADMIIDRDGTWDIYSILSPALNKA